ncbi:hypothetical protein BGZ83_002591 [Gryganskiella cystojenkinii]|nr:hypothetical protein BGZ83_002591 [Gryganskiella cystojenkinii]
MACQITNLGATITHLWVPDSHAGIRDVVLGFDDLTAYRSELDPYFGASVGRTANRIAKGAFSLPDQPDITYKLDVNNGPNSLHGGVDSFSHRMWDVEISQKGNSDHRGTSLRMSLLSEHMDQGFPGRLRVYCTIRLVNSTLEISYAAHLDNPSEGEYANQATIVSLTNHSYFNLNGVPTMGSDTMPTAPVTNHVMVMKEIDSFLELDSTSAPTGTVVPLDQVTAMDFRRVFEAPLEYLVSNDVNRTRPVAVVSVYSPESGIQMEMSTTEPGFQLYTANWVRIDPNVVDVKESTLDEGEKADFRHVGKARGGFKPHSGFCLETSKFPNAINHGPWKGQVILSAGDRYSSLTTFRFSTR